MTVQNLNMYLRRTCHALLGVIVFVAFTLSGWTQAQALSLSGDGNTSGFCDQLAQQTTDQANARQNWLETVGRDLGVDVPSPEDNTNVCIHLCCHLPALSELPTLNQSAISFTVSVTRQADPIENTITSALYVGPPTGLRAPPLS